MVSKLYSYIFIVVVLFFIGCDSNSKNTSTFFGGKIINPKSNFIVLFAANKVIDTIKLNNKNRFLKEFKDLKEGLYYFSHGTENQYIYLETNDSLMLRLNTWDFDESLVFAGKGAERNNILIDCFLEEENENRIFRKLNKLEPQYFKTKIDSILATKEVAYQDYITKHPLETDGFKKMLKVAFTYPVYARIERYPIIHEKYSHSNNLHLSNNNFFLHREKVNINEEDLIYYPPYSKYVRNYLYNLAYSLDHPPMTMEYSSEFTVDLLKIINNKIHSETSKNAFLKQTVIGHFYRKSSCDINEQAFETFFKLTTNNDDKKLIKKLLNDSKSLHKNKVIPNFHVYDLLNTERNIKTITKNKKSFLYFWNPKYVSPDYISKRTTYLMKEFPSIHFMQIRIDGNKDEVIKKLDVKNQYFIDHTSTSNEFLTSKMPRAILINEKGIVKNGYAGISSKKLQQQLKTLLKE